MIGGDIIKYIHYGHKDYDKSKFEPIQNSPHFSKPKGGLWASPINAKFGWKEWCDSESFRDCEKEDSFTFTINENANILYLASVNDLPELPKIRDERNMTSWVCLDFEKILSSGIDAIFVDISKSYEVDNSDYNKNLYLALYGWDCDSIVVMNPDIIQIEGEV